MREIFTQDEHWTQMHVCYVEKTHKLYARAKDVTFLLSLFGTISTDINDQNLKSKDTENTKGRTKT